jgi:hypothetical protein
MPLVIAAVVITLTMAGVRRRRHRSKSPPPRDAFDLAYAQLLDGLSAAGQPPDPSSTPDEVLAAVRADPRFDEELTAHAAEVVGSVRRARFARPEDRPADADAVRALASATRVRELARHL